MAFRLRMPAEIGDWLAELAGSQPEAAAEVGARTRSPAGRWSSIRTSSRPAPTTRVSCSTIGTSAS
jgi:hypothetical protein